jgi:hypothetical protein
MVYNDDGLTPGNFEKAAFEILRFKSENRGQKLSITFEKEVGENFLSQIKRINLKIHHVSQKPKNVILEGKSVEFKWSGKEETVEISLPLQEKKTELQIVFN